MITDGKGCSIGPHIGGSMIPLTGGSTFSNGTCATSIEIGWAYSISGSMIGAIWFSELIHIDRNDVNISLILGIYFKIEI